MGGNFRHSADRADTERQHWRDFWHANGGECHRCQRHSACHGCERLPGIDVFYSAGLPVHQCVAHKFGGGHGRLTLQSDHHFFRWHGCLHIHCKRWHAASWIVVEQRRCPQRDPHDCLWHGHQFHRACHRCQRLLEGSAVERENLSSRYCFSHFHGIDGGHELLANRQCHGWHCPVCAGTWQWYAASGFEFQHEYGRAQRHPYEPGFTHFCHQRHGCHRLRGLTKLHACSAVPHYQREPRHAGCWNGGCQLLAVFHQCRRHLPLHLCSHEWSAACGIEPEHEHWCGQRYTDASWHVFPESDCHRCKHLPDGYYPQHHNLWRGFLLVPDTRGANHWWCLSSDTPGP